MSLRNMEKDSAIFTASSSDMIGKRLLEMLRSRGYRNLLNDRHPQPDILDGARLAEFFGDTRPEYVFVTAGKSGGIQANREKPADLMLDNLRVVCSVINASFVQGVKCLLYLASSCSYPRMTPQPMKPEMLMTGCLEKTNAAYATAKLAGIELCKAYRSQHKVCFQSAIFANVFGPNDDFSESDSHVISGLIRRMHQAKEENHPAVEIWGTGESVREFIYIDDLADACLFTMEKYRGVEPINIGTGRFMKIIELARLVKSTVGYRGQLKFDRGKPDGMPKKILDTSVLAKSGWQSQISLETGIRLTYDWYCNHHV